MQHRVLALQRLRQLLGVADIALHDPQVGTVRQTAAEEQIVVDGDLIALVQQPRRQHMTDIAGAARDQHVFYVRIHSTPFAVHECTLSLQVVDAAPRTPPRRPQAIAAVFGCYAARSDPIGMVKAAVSASLWNIATVSSE